MTPWNAIEPQLDAILERRWYTNHGPMAKALEARCCDSFRARHAVIATNPTIGLIMLIEAIGLSGGILLSSLAPRRCVQAITWAGLVPHVAPSSESLTLASTGLEPRRTADVGTPPRQDPLDVTRPTPWMPGSRRGRAETPSIAAPSPDTYALEAAIRPQTTALLCTPDMDQAACAAVAAGRGLAFIGDGIEHRGGPRLATLPGFGDDAGIACLLTDDDQLAARLRNIRSSYGAGPPVAVARTANGRVSEAQAAMALLMLDEAGDG